MANRRMFSKTVTNASIFLALPSSARSLYYDIGMNTDDYGYCEKLYVIRLTDGCQADIDMLVDIGYVYQFDELVLYDLNFNDNNIIRKDRITDSKYVKLYPPSTICQPDDNQKTAQVRLGKVRLGKVKEDKDTLARQAISLFNDIAKTKHDINNPTHLKRCNIIIKAYKGNGTRDDAGILSKFEYVFTNQKKSADDPASGWDDKFYRLSTLTRKTNFFDYVDREPYKPEVKETSQQRRIRLLEEHTSDTK